jgi:hypothetical protein
MISNQLIDSLMLTRGPTAQATRQPRKEDHRDASECQPDSVTVAVTKHRQQQLFSAEDRIVVSKDSQNSGFAGPDVVAPVQVGELESILMMGHCSAPFSTETRPRIHWAVWTSLYTTYSHGSVRRNGAPGPSHRAAVMMSSPCVRHRQ